MTRARATALILAGMSLGLAAIPAAAQSVPVYAESPADALARSVRTLADHPKDFQALIAAGKAALSLGDAQSAAGFFGRAKDVNGRSPLPLEGMGAALVATGDPRGALTYFAQAQRLGASAASLGCDRGLAYDLLGQQVAAQTDYRAALNGADRDEARRRLALSLAITGNKTLALSTLQPLVQRGDTAAQRTRALILAVDGDLAGAKAALEYTMPGGSARMDPFFRRLPALTTAQKAAAVHLGIFPEDGVAMASNAAPSGDRLASIEDLLRQPETPPQALASPSTYANRPAPAVKIAPQRPARVQMASVTRTDIPRAKSPNNDLIETKRVDSDPNARKIWLQLASGNDPAELPHEFTRIKSRKPSLFTGLSGWIANVGARARLLIGPFHSSQDARLFADALQTASIDSFSWTSQPGQVVRKLPTQ